MAVKRLDLAQDLGVAAALGAYVSVALGRIEVERGVEGR